MNIQALMKQAQTLQKDMIKAKEEIDKMEFTSTKSFVTIVANGKKEVLKVSFDPSITIEKDDLEMLQDLIVVAINDVFHQIDKVTEEKMGKFSNIPGLF